MDLSLKDAATLLDCPPRTLRGRLARGEVPGRKVGGRWRIRRDDLPMSGAQRRAAQEKIAAIRDAVESAIPAGLRARIGAGHLDELDIFAGTRRIFIEVDAEQPPAQDVARALREAALAIAEGHYQYDRALEVDRLTAARGALGVRSLADAA